MTSDPTAFLLTPAAGCIAVAAAVDVAVRAAHRRARRRCQPLVPYAGFEASLREAMRTLLDCEGFCGERTAHEPGEDGTATCMVCGTPRALEPDEA